MFHLRCYWIVVCSVSLLLTSCGGKKTAEVIKSESQKSVALISHLKGHGVGFFIEGAAGVCTVLTAKHVVPDGKEISILTMTSKLPFKPLDIQRADNTDLTVVTFKPLDGNCPFPALKLGDSKDVVLTQPIYISSYPGGVNGQAPKQSFYISSVTNKTPGGSDGYELGYKTDTLGGTSGSPVLNEFGEVIAVHGRSYINKDVSFSGNDRAYLDLAIPIDLYKQNQISKVITSVDYNVRGMRKFYLGKKEEAIADYDLAIKLDPNYSAAYNNRGDANYNLGKKEKAIADYDRSIKINPNYYNIYINRGRAKYDLGKKEEAITDYDRSIKINPNHSSAYHNRGNAKYDLGKKEEAIADYDLAIKINPNYAYLHFVRGNVKVNLGKKEEAKLDYQEAARLYLQGENRKNYQKALDRIKELKI